MGQELMFVVVKVSGHRATDVGQGACDRTRNTVSLWFDEGICRGMGGYNFLVKGSSEAWFSRDGEMPIGYRGAVGY